MNQVYLPKIIFPLTTITVNTFNISLQNVGLYYSIESFFDEPISTYSTDMRARFGFSVANYVDPVVILLGEVLGVGDEAFRKKSTNAMKERIRSEKTVVIVSHSVPILKEVCDRVVWI